MAIHRRFRTARDAIRSRRARRSHAADTEAAGIDERLAALAAYVADRPFETTWDLFRFSYFKDMEEKQAVIALAAWALQQRVLVTFEIRKVRDTDVVFVVLRAEFK